MNVRLMKRRLSFPGFIDVHVHFRDPGVPEAETTATGLAAAARGGFAAVVTMPNTSPACDSPAALRDQREAAMRQSRVRLYPSACITRGRAGREVADLEALAEAGAAFFTDDGSYVADTDVLREAMRRIADLDMVLCQHAMTATDGVIRDCAFARKSALAIISPCVESEAIRRDVSLCRETGCRLHIQHISTAAGVNLVRDAQREGLPVTAEATPHHLLLSCDEIGADDANFKMAPPLGNNEDRAELRRAVKDGVLMFATDHAPHPASRKALGFAHSANGIIGLETAIPITYAVMVEQEGMPVEDWARAWYEKPSWLIHGFDASARGMTEIEIGEMRAVDLRKMVSLSRNCPYGGMNFDCWPVA